MENLMGLVRSEWVVLLRVSQKGFHLCAFAPQLAAVHLVDSHYCTDPGKFISVLCTSLSTMLHVELPHVNVLSKMDLIEQYGKLGKRLSERETWSWVVSGVDQLPWCRAVLLGGGWENGVNLAGFLVASQSQARADSPYLRMVF